MAKRLCEVCHERPGNRQRGSGRYICTPCLPKAHVQVAQTHGSAVDMRYQREGTERHCLYHLPDDTLCDAVFVTHNLQQFFCPDHARLVKNQKIAETQRANAEKKRRRLDTERGLIEDVPEVVREALATDTRDPRTVALGIRMMDLRHKLKFTEQEAADLCGISFITLQNIERGLQFPHDMTLKKIARGLDTDYEYLKFGTRQEPPLPEPLPEPEPEPLVTFVPPAEDEVVFRVAETAEERAEKERLQREAEAEAKRIMEEQERHRLRFEEQERRKEQQRQLEEENRKRNEEEARVKQELALKQEQERMKKEQEEQDAAARRAVMAREKAAPVERQQPPTVPPCGWELKRTYQGKLKFRWRRGWFFLEDVDGIFYPTTVDVPTLTLSNGQHRHLSPDIAKVLEAILDDFHYSGNVQKYLMPAGK